MLNGRVWALAGLGLALSGCAPALVAVPGQGKNQAQFQADDAACRGGAPAVAPQTGSTLPPAQAETASTTASAYFQCMAARGNAVVGAGTYSYAYSYPYPYGYPYYDPYYPGYYPPYWGPYGFAIGLGPWWGPGWGPGWGGPGWRGPGPGFGPRGPGFGPGGFGPGRGGPGPGGFRGLGGFRGPGGFGGGPGGGRR